MTKISSENKHRPYWMYKVQKLILRGQKQQSLNILEKVIGSFLPLFADDPVMRHERRLAWLLRINLLREWGRNAEALAWICLECELNPNNVDAQALKKRMLQDLNLISRQTEEIIDPSLYFKWAGVAGMRLLKTQLEREVLYPIIEEELYLKYKVSLPNGILFHGPPGCGKTFITRKLARELKFHFLEIKPSDLASIYVHGSQEKIGDMFSEAEEKGPTVLFIDEIDAFVPKRGGNDVGHHYSSEVNEFLSQLNEAWIRKVLVVGATNNINNIDQAILRPGRFDRQIYIGLPDMEARQELFKLSLKDRPLGIIDHFTLAKISEGFTPAEIVLICDDAARQAIVERKPISMDFLITEIESKTPQFGDNNV